MGGNFSIFIFKHIQLWCNATYFSDLENYLERLDFKCFFPTSNVCVLINNFLKQHWSTICFARQKTYCLFKSILYKNRLFL